ncbi:MAG: CPBP family intramembrane metalloprotease [Eubacterium sp.]|nr:CPBP family intramembrane metalloprotease [Eubacterium sp.]
MAGCKDGTGTAAARLTWRDIWQSAVPALYYTVLLNMVHALLVLSGLPLAKIERQALSVSACLLVFGWYAFRMRLAFSDKRRKRGLFYYPALFCYAAAVVTCATANNYLYAILVTRLGEFSPGYQAVTEMLYRQDLFTEIAAMCVLGPLIEELVFRGLVYQRLRQKGTPFAAAVWSALLFGLMHFNLVQCAYAFVLGLLLAHIIYRTGSLLAAAAAHMAANLASVLWTETDLLDFLNVSGSSQYAAALVCLVLTGIFLSYGNRMKIFS